jgi:hypothetical protein
VAPARISRKAPALLRLGTVAATAAGVGVLLLVSAAGVAVPALLFVGVPLTIFGAGLMLTSRFGTSGGLATLGVAAAVAAAGVATVGAGPWHVTDQRPMSVQEANNVALPMGINNINLSALTSSLEAHRDYPTIKLHQHNGALIVQVPNNVDVSVTAHVNRGGYDLFGTDGGGRFGNRATQAPLIKDSGPDGKTFGTDPVLTLDLSADNGFVQVERID